MLEITGADIAALSDGDLRDLVGLLCEAELRRRNLTLASVTWGGNQTAPDGGLDVRVNVEGANIEGLIPRVSTGFQVKKQKMPPSEILKEMRRGGTVRDVIKELIAVSGAYVIVSAEAASDSAIQRRRTAMSEAVADCPDAANIKLDFYDRGRVATWVRDHVGLIPWVRSRAGRSIVGWRSYGGWSFAQDDTDAGYIVDQFSRVRTGLSSEPGGVLVEEGINRIRSILSKPGGVVRLVGLSGVGKTRFVEALFDPEIGAHSLDSHVAIYANLADSPDPNPVAFASSLNSGGFRVVMVIDNCPASVHRDLSEVARSRGTCISVITIEYDIRDDRPEGTDVFGLENSSPGLIETLVARRYPALSQVDCRTVSEFSGGNARVALALASTVGKTETIAHLSDADLFRRLFQQRHEHDSTLLKISQAFSLLYSFDGETESGADAEIPILAGLSGKPPHEAFAAIAELKRRDLVQSRGRWRAVLPHAIANRLAIWALQDFSPDSLRVHLIERGSDRMRQSFSRRLSYLDSKEARTLAMQWLAPGGLLSNVAKLDKTELAMFRNIAPVVPNEVLNVLQSVLAASDPSMLSRCETLAPLLRSLAYDSNTFEQAALTLAEFSRLPAENDKNDGDPGKIFASLFTVALSGTLASVEQRVEVLRRLLTSPAQSARDFGCLGLAAILQTGHFIGNYGFEFGARSRGYGYYPPNRQSVTAWFDSALSLVESLIRSDESASGQLGRVVAREFRGLWTSSGSVNSLERVARALAARSFWREGWIAARQTLSFDAEGLSDEDRARLVALEGFLRPKDLLERVRGVVLNSNGPFEFDDDDQSPEVDYAAASVRLNKRIEDLGKEVGADSSIFASLVDELVKEGGHVVGFGHALAATAANPREFWELMVAAVAGAASEANLGLLTGFLRGLQQRDHALVDLILDETLRHPTLARSVPLLQSSVVIDSRGVCRLLECVANGVAPIWYFGNLAFGRACDSIEGAQFKNLLIAIGSRAEGMPVALKILSMRLFSDESQGRTSVPEVGEAGRALLALYEFRRGRLNDTPEDHDLGRIAAVSLNCDEGVPIVRSLCSRLLSAVQRYEVSAYAYDDLMAGLFKAQPSAALDELFAGDGLSQKGSVQLLNDMSRLRKNPIDSVTEAGLIGWCRVEPSTRYVLVAATARVFEKSADNDAHRWSRVAYELLNGAPDPVPVLREMIQRLRPSGWSGTLSAKLETRLRLLETLEVGTPSLKGVIAEGRAWLTKWIDAERVREMAEARSDGGSFE